MESNDKFESKVDTKWIKHVPDDRKPDYYETKYFKLSKIFDKEIFLNSLTYKAKDGDLFIATSPKNGTTWMQNIVHLIHNNGNMADSFANLWENNVFLEMFGKEAVESIQQPGSIKVHLPFELTPWNDNAKYIVVIRNPKDSVVSYYHHHVS